MRTALIILIVLAGLILLLLTIVKYFSFSFKNRIRQEQLELFDKSENLAKRNVSVDDISNLPLIVQKWLTNNGVVGSPFISNVYLTQELHLKLKPEQADWNKGVAEQYFTIQPPAFNWNLNTQMNPLLRIVGRDKFENGKGEMLIKLLSLIKVVDAKNDEKVNEATLQRYLAEIVWFPSAVLSNYIHWECLNDNSARATMKYNGTEGSGIFHFDENGQFQEFEAIRFKDAKDKEPTKWTVIATKLEKQNGIIIPTECEAIWSLQDEEWTWLKLKIKDISYNLEAPLNNNL